MNTVYCDSCGECLTVPSPKSEGSIRTLIGVSIGLESMEGAHTHVDKVKELFGKLKFNFCYVCWLKSLGAKPL